MNRFALVWAVMLVGMLGYSVHMFTSKDAIFVSSIHQIFPELSQDTIHAKALERSKEQLSNSIVLLLTHPSNKDLKAAKAEFTAKVEEISYLNIKQPTHAEIAKLTQLQSPLQGLLVSGADLQLLRTGQHHQLANRALLNLYGPSSMISGEQFKKDPLGLHQRYLEGLSNAGRDDFKRSENGLYYSQLLLNIQQTKAKSTDAETVASDVLAAINALSEAYPDLDVIYTGSPFYAAQIAKTSKSSAFIITAVALTGILILFLLNFRSLQSILGATLIIASGVITGAAALLAIFDNVHLIAVAFGSSLVGVVIDYAIHYYATRRNEDTPAITASRIRPGLILAVATTCLGFVALLFVDIALLRQIAVYAIFGVLGAMFSVLLLLPQRRFAMTGKGLSNPNAKLQKWHYGCLKPSVLGVLIIVCIASTAVIGGAIVPVADNVQNLRVSTPDLAANEAKIAKHGGNALRRVILIEASTIEAALRSEERLIDLLRGHNPDIEYFGISKLLPSLDRQEEICALKGSTLASKASEMIRKLAPFAATECAFLKPDTKMLKALPDFAKELVFLSEKSHGATFILQLSGIPAGFNLQKILEPLAFARELDISKSYSQSFADMRAQATFALLVGMLVITVLFSVMFGVKRGIAIAIVPTVAALLSLTISAYIGAGLSVFSVMAAFLVYALGADYALFQQASEPEDDARAYKAVALSSMSTILVFSLAAFSAIPVLQIMGSVIVLGVMIAWGIAPIARTFSKGDEA